MMKRHNILDTSVLLGAASSCVDAGINKEYEILFSIARNENEVFITCAEQKEEFYRNLRETRFETKEKENPDGFQNIRNQLESAICLPVKSEPHKSRYGKDAFVPALIDKAESKSVRVISRDKEQLRKIKADYTNVEIVDLNSEL